jgi:hypothetical protein
MRVFLPLLLAASLAGCSEGYGSTLLPTAEAGAPAPEYRVVVPAGYDVRSVDYDASLVGIASGENTSTSVRGRGVVAVYAPTYAGAGCGRRAGRSCSSTTTWRRGRSPRP